MQASVQSWITRRRDRGSDSVAPVAGLTRTTLAHRVNAIKARELAVVADRQNDVAVLAREHLVGHDVGMRIAVALGMLPETR